MSFTSQALWDQFVSPLGEEFHTLFSESTRSSDLLDLIIKPSAHTGTNYRSIEFDQYVTGRADDNALILADPDLPPESWHDLTFFTNEMEIDRGRNLAPKQRAVFGQHIVFTFEYDWDDLGFFKEQLGWLLPSKQGPKISKISRLYEHCCQWADFRGICVVWSGSKSLHLHSVFETTTFQKRHPRIVAPHAHIISPANDDESDAYLVEASPLERRFGPQFLKSIRSAADGEEARAILETHIPDLIEQERISLVRGPEGVAKTGSIMACHPEIVRRIGQAGLTMYAFADYRNAAEKCAAFNRLGHPGLRGIVWKSFTRAYAEICEELGISPINYADAAKGGHQSHWSEVTRKQPIVIDALKARHAAMWDEIGDAMLVIFTVHDVAHRWRDRGRTRRLWTKSFWCNAADEGPQIEETRLAFLVHDEIKIRTFCNLVSASVIAWLLAMRDQNPAIWRENHFSLQAKALENHAMIQKSPGDKLIDVAEAKRLLSVMNWDEVTTADTGEYVVRDADETDLDIYARRHGKKWLAAPKRWWREGNRQIADRIVFLTTEAVPTAAARKAHPSIFVVDFETDHVPPDNVEAATKRNVTAENLPDIIEKRIQELREETKQEWSVVSNKIAALNPDLQIDATTHATARGSNSLIGKNILQTATFMAGEQYEELQALNAWAGRTDLVLMTHIDELNQSCGRNLRFRRRGRERHLLLINRRLYDLLNASGMFGSLRYRLSLHMDNDDRKNERREG